MKPHDWLSERMVFGLLIIVGLLIFFDQFSLIVKYLQPYLPTF